MRAAKYPYNPAKGDQVHWENMPGMKTLTHKLNILTTVSGHPHVPPEYRFPAHAIVCRSLSLLTFSTIWISSKLRPFLS